MAVQLVAGIIAGSVGAFKGKEHLHDYLMGRVAVVSVYGDVAQRLDGSGRSIVIEYPVIKPRDCRLSEAGRLTAAIRQGAMSLNMSVFLEPVLRLRPAEYVQSKLFEFRIPDAYDTRKQGFLILDLQYSCKKGNESVYLDVPIRALRENERSHILIMKQAREFNESGIWKKGEQ